MARRNEIENTLPRITSIGKQCFILHLHDNENAFLMTGFREDVVETILNSAFEISRIEVERNRYGMCDFHVFCCVQKGEF